MKIDRSYLGITEIASDAKDVYGTREVLTYLLVERIEGNKGRIVAADGFMLAVVPCELTEDDVPGLITVKSLKQAAKDMPKAMRNEVCLVLQDGCVRTLDGNTMPRPDAGLRFPDISRIIPRDAFDKATDGMVAFNHTYLGKLGKALSGLGVKLYPTGEARPIVVLPINGGFEPDGMPAMPYAVLMPMHVARPAARKSSAA